MPQRLGQNFLTDRSVAGRILRAAHITPESVVVEVGPGRGALTFQLAASAKSLVVIEFDPALAAELRQRFAGHENVAVVEADARTVDPAGLLSPSPSTGEGWGEGERLPAGQAPASRNELLPYSLVANLPYYAATPIIRNFLESSRPPGEMVVMVQREVADEMRAAPGDMSLLSIAIQVYADVEKLFDVPPSAFTPQPKVFSSVVRITPLAEPKVPREVMADFFRLVKAGFKAPRKQMHNSLGAGLNVDAPLSRSLLAAAGIDSERRPATVSIPEWLALFGAWTDAGKPFITHGTPRDEREKALRR